MLMDRKPTYEELEQRVRLLAEKADACRQEADRCNRRYEESKHTEQLYRSLIHSSADAIVFYDLQGRVRYVNPAFTRLFGWTMEAIEGRQIPFVPDTEKDRTTSAIGEVLDGQLCHGFETRRLTRDGRLLDVSISASRYMDYQDKPAGMLVILRDVSERVRMGKKLIQAQKLEAIGTLAGGIAHDFNNLLMGIQGNASLLLFHMDVNDPQREKLKNIEKYVHSGADLTKQLLGFARRGKYEARRLDVRKLLADSVRMFGRTRKDISIFLDCTDELWSVKADRGQLEQVLLNLYVNAGQAMPEGGKLFVEAMNMRLSSRQADPREIEPGPYAKICVRDTGVGIDEPLLQKIFDPFFTTRGMGRGSGLGLASAYGIVKNHGGTLTVESRRGEGAAFTIYLPAIDQPADVVRVARQEVIRGSETLLLVDDEEMIIDIGRQMMQAMGYRVITARSGKEALDIFRRQGSDIQAVILDMVMPEMSGAETFDRLRRIDPDVRVLLSSGYSRRGQAQEILDRGCRGFIQKPFKLEEFSQKIREILVPVTGGTNPAYRRDPSS